MLNICFCQECHAKKGSFEKAHIKQMFRAILILQSCSCQWLLQRHSWRFSRSRPHQPTLLKHIGNMAEQQLRFTKSWPPWTWSPFQRTLELLSFQMKQQVDTSCRNMLHSCCTNKSITKVPRPSMVGQAGWMWLESRCECLWCLLCQHG